MTKDELKKEFYKYIKDHEDYFDPREPWTERIILQIWLDCAEPREKRIKELEKDKQYFSDSLDKQIEATLKLDKENAELSEKLNRHKHDCPNCSAFGKHCPHRVNGDPYTYDCYLTVADLEKENAELDCQKNRNKYCYSCANATEKCFKNEIGCPCDKYKSYKDENAELKEKLGNVQMQKAGEKSDLVWKLKTANEQKADQLTKAKELLKWWVNHCGDHDLFYAEKTEKFLREVNK